MVVSLVCTVTLGLLGHQVEMVVMAVTEPKETRAARERLDPRAHQELLVPFWYQWKEWHHRRTWSPEPS